MLPPNINRKNNLALSTIISKQPDDSSALNQSKSNAQVNEKEPVNSNLNSSEPKSDLEKNQIIHHLY